MQQTFEQSGFPTVLSREPVQDTKAMRSGILPSLGRNTVLYGRVGASRRSICIPVITLGYLPQPYSGFTSAGKSLYPVETTTAPIFTSSTRGSWRLRFIAAD